MPLLALSELHRLAENIVTMVWVSNHTPKSIQVRITNTTGGSADWFTVSRSIPYPDEAVPEKKDDNWWPRDGPETLHLTVGEKGIKFTVNKDDHVILYEDTYETFPAKWGFF
jgi:hypothetical protein